MALDGLLRCPIIQGACRYWITVMFGILRQVRGKRDESTGKGGALLSSVRPVWKWISCLFDA